MIGTISAKAREVGIDPVACRHSGHAVVLGLRPCQVAIRGIDFALRVGPELADPVGPLEVREHQDVEQFGGWSRPERIQALAELALELIGSHCLEATPSNRRPRAWRACPYTFMNAGAT